ncbi:MAG: cation:proton antiporter [Methanomicrobiales archaeon]|nr:cation:proton antiporter [Methanomicrobiales archaeon]
MIADLLILACVGIGLLFNTLGIIGILRFPDVYTRLHAETKTTTFGTIFLAAAVVVYGVSRLLESGDGQYLTLSVHTVVALLALAVTNATGAHAIARAAHRSGQAPSPAVIDRYLEEEA